MDQIDNPIYEVYKNENGIFSKQDQDIKVSFNEYITQRNPDLIWTFDEPWDVFRVAIERMKGSFKWIGYVPIEGEPLPARYITLIENMDMAVAYGKYGIGVIKSRVPKANLTYIPLGVNSEIFRPLSHDLKQKAKEALGIDPSKIVIGVITSVQPKKDFDKVFEALFYLIHGAYLQCNECGKISLYPYNLVHQTFTLIHSCRNCHSSDCKKGIERDDIRLYIHGPVFNCGWSFSDLQHDYNLYGKVFIEPALHQENGVSQSPSNEMYNALDIFIFPTKGEEFGLELLKAMAAGIPIIATDYSAHVEWSRSAGELVPPIAFKAIPVTNVRKAIINLDEFVGALLKLINDKDLREKYGVNGREIAQKMDPLNVCMQWEQLIDNTLQKE
jgi:glycosyltransferase involved in cell wall biosynthesis